MKIDVLDHGYVRFVEAWGHGDGGTIESSKGTRTIEDMECGIIEAARQSTQSSFRGWEPKECNCSLRSDGSHYPWCDRSPGDAKLLRYLYEHNHATPFEFAGMVIEVQAPIFVFREWHRHRTQSYNEMSARYAPLPDLYYVPTVERLRISAGKQGGASGLDELGAEQTRSIISGVYTECESEYQNMLENGVPKELARLVMPVGHYSRMRASANLRNWLAFMTLRTDPAAQWEIRKFAESVGKIIAQKFPRTFFLWAQEVSK